MNYTPIKSRVYASNDAYKQIWENALNIVGSDRIKNISDIATKRIEGYKKEYGDELAYGWSGGKDSIVIEILCRKLGVKNGYFAHCNLEYNFWLEYCLNNLKSNVKAINTEVGFDYIKNRPDMLFCYGQSKVASKWYKIVQINAQDLYIKREGCRNIILGRRKKDNNFCGKNGVFVSKKKVNLSPIFDWNHEDVFAFLEFNKIELPPIYLTKNGFMEGTHPWAARYFPKTEEEAWKEIYKIESKIVEDSSVYFDSAKRFLDEQ